MHSRNSNVEVTKAAAPQMTTATPLKDPDSNMVFVRDMQKSPVTALPIKKCNPLSAFEDQEPSAEGDTTRKIED